MKYRAVTRLLMASGALIAAQSASAQDAVSAVPARQGAEDNAEKDDRADDIIVTGTRVRGVAPVGSAVISVGAAELADTAAASASDLLLRIPQVANIGFSDSTAVGGQRQQGAAGNITFTRSINLRGVGPTATLTLFNGQRFAPTLLNNGADLDLYPTGLVSRIEIVADGGSATYGSDAIAGTVNVVLRRPNADIAQATGQVRMKHGSTDWQTELLVGKKWGGGASGAGEGGLMVAFSHNFQDEVWARDYRNIYNDDLTPYIGAAGLQPVFANPGNVLGLTGPGGTTALYAIPSGITGTQRLLLSQLGTAGQPNRESVWLNATPLPRVTRDTIAAVFRQQITPWLTVFANGLYSYRSGEATYGSAPVENSTIAVPATNPYSPCAPGVDRSNGQGLNCAASNSVTVRYAWTRELGPLRRTFYQESYGGTYGFDIELPHGWNANVTGHWSRNFDDAYSFPRINPTALAQVVSGVGKPASIPFLNPFCSGTSAPCNDPATLAYISGRGNWVGDQINRLQYYNISANGPVFDLPGGTVRMAVGADHTISYFQVGTYSELTDAIGVKVTNSFSGASRNVDSVFGELYIPLVGDGNAGPLVRSLELVLAGRITDYSDVGSTSNPKIGITYKPFDDLRVRASYGTSFRAPSLRDADPAAARVLQTTNSISCGQLVKINLAACSAGAATPVSAYNLIGGNADIGPEKAKVWSAGIDFTPHALPGFTATIGYYNIAMTDRILQAAANAGVVGAVNEGIYDSLITYNPTYFPGRAALTQAQYDAAVAALVASFPGTVPASGPVTHFVDGRQKNVGTLKTDGVDFSIAYDARVAWGRIHGALSGTYVFNYKTQEISTVAALQNVNIFGYPPRFRARADAGFDAGPWSGSLFVNYTNAYRARATNIPAGASVDYLRISQFATVDLSLSHEFGSTAPALLRGMQITAFVENVLDSAPPFFLNAAASPALLFDPQNASPLGRVVSLRLSKRF